MSDYTGPGVYVLVSVATKTVINLSGANPANKTPVIGWYAALLFPYFYFLLIWEGKMFLPQTPSGRLPMLEMVNTCSLMLQLAHTWQDLVGVSFAYSVSLLTNLLEGGAVTGNLISPIDKTARWTIVPAKAGNGAYM